MAKSNPNIPCAIDGCGKPLRNRGWCSMHYERWRLFGSTDDRRPTMEERFWASVDQSAGPHGCWIWTGSINNTTGYGQLGIGKRYHAAHRISFELAGNEIGKLFIDHMCHNRVCVNPAHLRLVTQKQNNENRKGAQSNSLSGIRGVSRTSSGKWQASAYKDGRNYYAGYHFGTADEAAEAARLLRLKLFTHSDGR